MSEQSGPITREQVERAIAGCQRESLQAVADALGGSWWVKHAPQDVRDAWHGDGSGWGTAQAERLEAALTRWRDELAAAERSHGKVARWDAARGAYVALDDHGTVCMITPDRETAIGWGYGVAPAEDSPERLRERRERLGWTTAYAGHWVPWFDHTDVERAESGKGIPAFVARYAAALSAAEAERAASKPHMTPSFRRDIAVMRATGASLSAIADKYLLSLSEVSEAIGPEAQPAPEVVDVPRPVVVAKRCGHVVATWRAGGDCVTVAGAYEVDVPLALLRAMLAAIDAQQGGAS